MSKQMKNQIVSKSIKAITRKIQNIDKILFHAFNQVGCLCSLMSFSYY